VKPLVLTPRPWLVNAFYMMLLCALDKTGARGHSDFICL